MRSTLKLTAESMLGKVTRYASKAPAGLEAISSASLIKLLREKLFMTQAQLAKRAGVPQSHIAKIEKGMLKPRLDTLQKIIKALYCDLLIVPKPRRDLDRLILEKIHHTAKKKVESVKGTMQLENQLPSSKIAAAMVKNEELKLRLNPSAKIWEE